MSEERTEIPWTATATTAWDWAVAALPRALHGPLKEHALAAGWDTRRLHALAEALAPAVAALTDAAYDGGVEDGYEEGYDDGVEEAHADPRLREFADE